MDASQYFTDEYRQFINHNSGEEGRTWLRKLPGLLQQAELRWDIQLLPPFTLSYNYVAPARRRDGSEVVLKAGLPGNLEVQSEIETLRAYAGEGMARLLEEDRSNGLFLIERMKPGAELAEVEDDEEATRTAAAVMRKLRRPVPAGTESFFASAESWAKAFTRLREQFDGATGPFDAAMISRAEGFLRELLPSQGKRVLLHGDLHHWNILSSERGGWLAIDPKWLIAEAEYEPGALLRNPIPQAAGWPELARIQQRRIAILCEELGFDCQRVAAWAFAQAVLAAVWSFEEDGIVWQPWLTVMKSLSLKEGQA